MNDWHIYQMRNRHVYQLHSNYKFLAPTVRWLRGYQPEREWSIPVIALGAFAIMFVVACVVRWI